MMEESSKRMQGVNILLGTIRQMAPNSMFDLLDIFIEINCGLDLFLAERRVSSAREPRCSGQRQAGSLECM